MSSGAVTEILYHFAGYLHIYNETARVRVEYEDFSSKKTNQDLKPTPDGLAGKHHELEELDSHPVAYIFSDDPVSPLRDLTSDRLRLDRPDPLDNPYDLFQSLIQSKLPKFPIQITLGATEPKITVSYQDGGDQLMSLVQQFNRLADNDKFGIPEGMTVDTLSSREIDDAVADMMETADAEIPDDLVITNFANDALLEFVTERDAAAKEAGETTKSQVDAGTYVNGELQPEDAELPKPPESQPVESFSEVFGEFTGHPGAAQIIESGSNEVVNIAVIADVNHLSGTMVIVGDHYTTDAIVQVTVLMDEDAVSHAGLGAFTIETHGNEMYNVAKFLQSDFGVPSFAGSNVFAGLEWNVDVFEGDLYDVHSVTQSSWLKDNDITYQGVTDNTFQVFAGANGQFNISTLEALGSTYDLIIVNGNYHHANLIYQKILLLDPDIVKVLGNGVGSEDDEAPGSSISTGENFLFNEAVIENFGTTEVNDLTAELQALIDSLNAQDGVLDVSAGMGLPNFDDGSFDVLVISGSYYDINVINQEIVATDVDTLMQFLPAEGEGDEYVPQTTDAGGNVLTNLGAIVTTGAAADYYVGGDQYDDEILIQAEIIVSDDDTIIHEDPDALATELVAFTSSDADEDDIPETFLPVNDYATSDVLGSTLT